MEVKWSDKQLQAINEKGNLLVAAAAGSGKTAVLTERIAKLISDGADIKNMLIVTFTNAAAAEMKKRISKRLNEIALSCEGEEKSRLTMQAQSVPHANISTFHSFCMHILRRHFYEAELDPAFRNADETQAEIIKDEAMEKCIECFAEDEEIAGLYRMIGNEKAFIETVLSLYEKMNSNPEPMQWLDRAVSIYNVENVERFDETEVAKQMVLIAKMRLEGAKSYNERALKLIAPDTKAYEFIQKELDNICFDLSLDKYSELYDALKTSSGGRISWKGVDDSDKEIADELRKKAKDIKNDILKKIMLRPVEEECKMLFRLYKPMRKLQEFITKFDETYKSLKNEKNVIDFSDMEHIALKLLDREHIANEYRRKIQYIFVDEYQDSNLIQETIINKIKHDDNLFMVGDVKQSIYSFRLADPTIFLDKYYRYGNNSGGMRIDLNANYRSSTAVIEFVNCLFEKIMRKDTGGIEYDDNAKLIKGRTNGSGEVEVDIIYDRTEINNKNDEDEYEDEENDEILQLEDDEKEAMLAAQKIKDLVGTEYEIDGEKRKIQYSDIVILLRSVKNKSWMWTQILTAEGIPVYADVSGGYFDALEIKIFLNLLSIIDNSRQDIPLLSVMRSPIGGFAIEEIVSIRANANEDKNDKREKKSVLDCLKISALNDSPIGEKSKRLVEKINEWKKLSKQLSVADFIAYLLETTNYFNFVGALPGGKQRQANINALITKAEAYENSIGQGLWGFLSYMEKVGQSSVKDGAVQLPQTDVVRLMSIHKSKGLEFPIVIIASAGKNFNKQTSREKLVCDSKVGFGIKCIDTDKRREIDPITRRACAFIENIKGIEEEMRVLYVALTRAKEKLIIIGKIKKLGKYVTNSIDEISSYDILNAKGTYEWLLYMLMTLSESEKIKALFIPDELIKKDYADYLGDISVNLYSDVKGYVHNDNKNEAEFKKWKKYAVEKSDISKIDEVFSKAYPHMNDTKVPSKVSVSSLAKDDNEINMVEMPQFMLEDGTQKVLATDIGTATHEVMHYISIKKHTKNSIEKEIEDIVAKGLLSPQQGQYALVDEIYSFFVSDLGNRMLSSERVEREMGFNYLISASRLDELNDKYHSDEKVLLQGIIDCCFIENGKWILVDYKTDRKRNGVTVEEMANHHARQLNVYAEALHMLTGIEVAEKYVYFLRFGQAVKI